MFNPSRDQVRLFFCEAWRKHRAREILDGAEAVAADLIAHHPEYHALLEDPDKAIDKDFTPDSGQMNPFLHLSLHLAVADQLAVDRPQGVRAAYENLRQRLDVHDAEHVLIECLGEALWRAQGKGDAMDAAAYLDSIWRKAGA